MLYDLIWIGRKQIYTMDAESYYEILSNLECAAASEVRKPTI
jgi:hypothetical protein